MCCDLMRTFQGGGQPQSAETVLTLLEPSLLFSLQFLPTPLQAPRLTRLVGGMAGEELSTPKLLLLEFGTSIQFCQS